MILGNKVKDQQQSILTRVLYVPKLATNLFSAPDNQASIANETGTKLDLWHQRMAHLNVGQMKTMASKELTTGSDIPGTGKLSFCEACAEGKAHRAPFKPVGEIQSTRRLELVHSDVAGPMKTKSFGGAKYFVTLSMIIPDVSLFT